MEKGRGNMSTCNLLFK